MVERGPILHPYTIPKIRAINHRGAEEYLKLLGNGHRAYELSHLFVFPDLVLVHNAPKIHYPPLTHENSEACYLADFYDRDNRVLLSYLLPFSRSSLHSHKEPIKEWYYLLFGKVYLTVNGKTTEPQGLVLIPEERHWVFTLNQPALLLIVMENAKFVPEDKQHLR